ncbi:MAG: penicillin-binding protein 2 [Nitrospiria bacterium]
MGGRYFPEEDRTLENKIYRFFALILIGLLLLLFRAWDLQVVNEKHYLDLSENNRLRLIETPPPRGRIYDRHGKLLVNNVPSFNLYLVRADMPAHENIVQRLTRFAKIEPGKVLRKLESENGDPYRPIKIKEDLTIREVAQIEGHGLELPGVKIEAEFKRHAVSGMLGAHLLGYVGEITQVQRSMERYQGIKAGTIIGQYGVEHTYDAILQGVPGGKRIEVDVLGHERQVVHEKHPQRGDDIYLTLDLRVQKTAEAALNNRPGAIVAIDPRNGEILAMVSHPSFDPNILSKGASSEAWKALLEDEKRPLTNRVIQGQYPPGSIFKIIVGTAVLDMKLADPADQIECKGFIRLGRRDFRDWKVGGHGWVDLRRSLVESCDIYYYEKGRELGVDTIAKYSRMFGLGSPTGIDLSFEKGGLIPTTEWKRRVQNEPWYPGETLSVAIGQGFVSTTPLQLATALAAVIGQGVWHTPHIFLKSREYKTGVIWERETDAGKSLPVSVQTLRTIRDALTAVVSDERGTGRKARSQIVSIGGKTGTAQVVGRTKIMKEVGEKSGEIPEAFRDHAWFASFAPVDHPEIAVVVLVENGGHGGATAAPIAKRVIESYFNTEDDMPEDNMPMMVGDS